MSNTASNEEDNDPTTKSFVASQEDDRKPSSPVAAEAIIGARARCNQNDASYEDLEGSLSSDSEEGNDLILEGVMIRNPEVPSSSSDDEDDASSESDDDDDESKEPTAKKQKRISQNSVASEKTNRDKKKKSAPAKSKSGEPEIINVDFIFCDMDEKFFHGIKTLLHSSSTVYAQHSSALSDLMIENISIGTIIAMEGDQENNVYGFASILNVASHGDQPCIQQLKEICLNECPAEHKAEMETVLSGKTRRPAGFLFHGRMVNLPLEVVEILHQQLVLDLDWAREKAEVGEEERKSLDFGAFVRLAPAFPSSGSSAMYKYFDDEIFASQAEIVYTVHAPKLFSSDEKQLCTVIVMTKDGHQKAMKELAKLVRRS